MKPALAVAVLLLLAACSDPDPQPSGPPPSTPTSPATAESDDPELAVDGRPIHVGVLVGARLRDVRRRLDELGLDVVVRRRARCVPGVVLEQVPSPGTEVERGSTVEVVVSRAPAAATCIQPPGIDAAHHLRAWALGDEPAPDFADRVRLLVANVPVRTLSGREVGDRERWRLDVAYAERVDVPVLEILAAAPMRVRDVPPWFCPDKAIALPADLVRRLPWSGTLVTRRARSCMEVAAVQVCADEGRITDVNVLMGSP